MAEEMTEISESIEAPPKSRKMLFILIGLVVVLGAGGGAAFFFLRGSPSESSASTGVGQAADPGADGDSATMVTVPLKTFIVNLSGNGGSRYLKVSIEVELTGDSVKTEMAKKNSQVVDTILTLLTCKTYDDIKDIQGKALLKEEIVSRVNTVLTGGRAQRAYFTEFVVQ